MGNKRVVKLHEPVTGKAEVDAVRKVLESGWLAEGNQTERFENTVAEYVGSKFAVAVSNCTVALELCLKALNITEEVITPAFGHPATVRAIINAGATPLFCDVDIKQYNMIEQGCTYHQAVVGVSWGGNPYWFSDLLAYHQIEDSACSLGASFDGHKTGSVLLSCFSFHPRKLITTGEGGIITTNDEKLAETLRDLKNFGYSNYKFDDIRAAIGIEQMKRLEGIIQERIRKAQVYNELLKTCKNIKTPHAHELARHTYQTYAIYINKGNRDRLIIKLKDKGIECQVGAYALHRLPSFRDFGRIGNLRNSELLDRRLLALPMAHSMNDEDQQYVVECLKGELA